MGEKVLELNMVPEDAGTRLDKCVARYLGPDYSRTFVKTLIDDGAITVDGVPVKPNHAVRAGERVRVEMPAPRQAEEIGPEDIPVDVLYEDSAVIVVNKPAGMVVHPGAGNMRGTLVNALLHHCGRLPDTDDVSRPGIVHRLDKDTSGVMVVAKTDKALRSLARQFQERAVKKAYIAVVSGKVELDNGIVEAPIARHVTDRKKMQVEFTEGKNARTIYHVLRRGEKFSLLRVELETGRTHQIRVHMDHIGHPVAGDAKYGSGTCMRRQALHAEYLGFTHPVSGDFMEFTAPIPEDIKSFIDNNLPGKAG